MHPNLSAAVPKKPTPLRVATPAPAAKKGASKRKGVVDQVRTALRPQARLATAVGAILGGFVPVAVYVVAHHELDLSRPLWAQFGALLVLGGLAYSASTVYSWGRLAFRSPVKAAGFVVLLEGVLVGAQTAWLALAALVVLAGVNAIATGAILSSDDGVTS